MPILLHYLPLDEPLGTPAEDLGNPSEVQELGNIYGPADDRVVAGKFGSGRLIRNAPAAPYGLGGVALASAEDPSATYLDAYAVSVWMRFLSTANPADPASVISYVENNGASRFYLSATSAGELTAEQGDPPTTGTSASVLTLNQWHLIVVTRGVSSGADRFRVFVDGAVVIDLAGTEPMRPASSSYIAAQWWDTDREIDDFAIWGEELTSADVAALWNAGNGAVATAVGTLPGPKPTEVTSVFSLSEVTEGSANSVQEAEDTVLLSEVVEADEADDVLIDTVELSDAIDEYGVNTLISEFELSSAMAETRESRTSERLRVREVTRQAGTMLVEDTIEMGAAVEDRVGSAVSDTATMASTVEMLSVGQISASDTVRLRDAARSGSTSIVEDTLSLSSATLVGVTDTVTATLALSATSEDRGLRGDEVSDAVVLAVATESQRVAVQEVSDTVRLRDDVAHKLPGAIAWVMNTETGAASWYSNWQFVDMVQLTDRVLAVGPEGLVELGADSDAGDEIDAELEYGFMDFGVEQKKRIDAFWFGYTSSDVVEVEVETIDGPGHSYRMQPRNADSPRNNRVRPGKGLNARYWRIKVRNSGGADLAVDSISADAALSARRL